MHLTPVTEHKKSLYEQILTIENHTDLKKPITDMADVVRKAGNKGAHFDPINKPTQKTLELTLDLIDALVEYFFIIPSKTQDLKEHVNNLSPGK
jgi:hypothetical protein